MMKWFLVILAAIAAGLIGFAIWVSHADLTFLKPTIEAYVEEATGRSFSIGGQFTLTLDDHVVLVAEDLQLSNGPWSNTPMATIEQLVIKTDYPSLLSRTLVIRDLILHNSTLALEQNDRRNTWSLGDSDSQDGSGTFRFVLQQARLHNAKVMYNAPALKRPLDIVISSAKQEHNLDDDSISGHIVAAINGRPVELRGLLNSFDNLRAGQDIEYDMSGNLGALTIQSQGTIDNVWEPTRPTLELGISSTDIDEITAMLGLPDVGDGGFRLNARLTSNRRSLTASAQASLPGININATGRSTNLAKLADADFDIAASGPQLGRLFKLFDIDHVPLEPFQLTANLRQSDSNLVIDDARLSIASATIQLDGALADLPRFDPVYITLNATGPDLSAFNALLVLPYSFTGAFELDAEYRNDDGRTVLDANLATAPLSLEVSGPLGSPPNIFESQFQVHASGNNLHAVASILAPDHAALRFTVPDPFELKGNLTIEADGLRAENISAKVRDGRLFGDVAISGSKGAFSARGSLPNLQAWTSSIESWHPATLPIDLSIAGSWNPDHLQVDSGELSFGEATARWTGLFDYPPDGFATDLDLNITIPDLAALGLIGDKTLPSLPMQLEAHFDGSKASFVMDAMDGNLGATTFSGSLHVQLSDPIPKIDADIEFDILDFRDWADDADLQVAPTQVIPDYPIPIQAFAKFDGAIDITANTIHLSEVSLTDALVTATLLDGSLRVTNLDVVAPRGKLDGTLDLRPTDRGAEMEVTFQAQNLGLNLAGDPQDLEHTILYDLDLDLGAQGNSTRELAATLTGTIQIDSDGGRFHNRNLSLLYSDFGRELLFALNPLAKQTPYTEITCAKVVITATHGLLQSAPNIIVQTDKINLISKGSIDLATEKIDFNFNTKPRKRLSISASELLNPYIRVAGTLSKPRLTLNTRGTAVAALTAGWSILAQAAWDRTFQRQDPCQ